MYSINLSVIRKALFSALFFAGLRCLAASIHFSQSIYSVEESTSNAVITVIRNGALSNAVTVDYIAAGGTAIEGSNYVAQTGTLVFAAGQTSVTFTVPLIDDGFVEPNKTVTLHLSNSIGATLVAPAFATLILRDDDSSVQFTAGQYYAAENNSYARVSLRRTGDCRGMGTVDFGTSDGSAIAGIHYSNTIRTVTFNPGVVTRQVIIPVINNFLDESNQTFGVWLANPGGRMTLGSRSNSMVTIRDDDHAGVIQLSSSRYVINEAATNLLVTVVRNGGAAGVSVDFETINGTATEGADYTGVSGTLIFPAGVYRLTFAVPIIDDAVNELRENFKISLSNPKGGARLGLNSNSTVIIVNDIVRTTEFAPESLIGWRFLLTATDGSGMYPASGSYRLVFLPSFSLGNLYVDQYPAADYPARFKGYGGYLSYPIGTNGVSMTMITFLQWHLFYELPLYSESLTFNFNSPSGGTYSIAGPAANDKQSGKFKVLSE